VLALPRLCDLVELARMLLLTDEPTSLLQRFILPTEVAATVGVFLNQPSARGHA
jgi:hypothetical protein